MIEVDVFWSFAIGASFAAFAGKNLKNERLWDVNKFFIYTLVYLTLIFSPSGVYLLWQFPGWESMYVFSVKQDLNALLPFAFALTNVLLGAIGFYMAYSYVRFSHYYDAHSLWLRSYSIMFGILGFGYRRFLYAGDGPAWFSKKAFPLEDFFSSEVFYTLLVMGVIVLPLLFVPQIKWFYESGNTYDHQVDIWSHLVGVWFSNVILGAIGYLIFLFFFNTEEDRKYYIDKDFEIYGPYIPLVGFVVAQVALLLIISFQLLVPRPPKAHAE